MDSVKRAVLLVGEGDFSFAASYISSKAGLDEEIYATCLNGLQATDNTTKIKELGGFVYTDVDATGLEFHPHIKHVSFEKIIFNFPHVKKKMNIRDNRKLLREFFCSARKVLKENGEIVVTLCKGQGGTQFDSVKREWSNTWQICSLAASASLILVELLPFNPENFLTYRCTGYRGLEKPFNTTGALTHVFCPAPCAEIEVKEMGIDQDIREYYLQSCKSLFLNMTMNLDGPFSPSSKIISFLRETIIENVGHFPEIVVPTLLTCTNFVTVDPMSVSQPPSHSEVYSSNICSSCLKHLAELYLQNSYFTTHVISPFICSICCSNYFDAFKLPFYKCVAYFSLNENSVFSFFNLIKEKIREIFDHSGNVNVKDQTTLNELHTINSVEAPSYIYEDLRVKQIVTVYASYSLKEHNGLIFYCDVNIQDSKMGQKSECSDIRAIEIGSIFLLESKMLSSFWCFMLNIDLIACLKFHISDKRTLFCEGSYFPCTLDNTLQLIYRCKSISPPIFVHDTSFWIEDDFRERDLFLLIRSFSHLLIKEAVLIESYYHEIKKKFSKCYRFHYQSCNNALSKDKANDIHTKIIRKAFVCILKLNLR